MTTEEYKHIENTLRSLSLYIYNCKDRELRSSPKRLIESVLSLKNPTIPEDFEVLQLNQITNKEDVLEFNQQEILKMPQKIRSLILIDKKRCRIRKKKSGKNSFNYEIRFRRDGYEISGSGTTIELAKKRFIENTRKAKPKNRLENLIPESFESFANYYFENFRKEKVSALTYKTDLGRYKIYIRPFFKNKQIKDIIPNDCRELLNEIKKQGKGKTADEVHSILNGIFKSAVLHRIIPFNPLDTVFHVQHQTQPGQALTKEEEKILLSNMDQSKYSLFCALTLYAGLRPNELKKVKIEGPFLIAENSKRKHKRIEYKKIPIIKKLEPYIVNGIPEKINLNNLREHVRQILPGHTLKDLRKTFNSRCKEYGVSDHARKEFMGHTLSALDGAYTELSDEYLINEANKLNEW